MTQLPQPESENCADSSESGGLRDLRRHLAAAVLARLRPEIPNISAHFGEDYEETNEPEAIVYRRTGGTFRFLAFAFKPWRMWDLHVGVVPVSGSQLSIGFHISERAAPILMAALKKLAANNATTVIHQNAAVEYQANLPPLIARNSNVEILVNAIVDLCRQLAPIAEKLSCSPDMAAET